MLLWLTGRRRGWRGKGEEVPCKLQILPADYHRRVGTRCDSFFFFELGTRCDLEGTKSFSASENPAVAWLWSKLLITFQSPEFQKKKTSSILLVFVGRLIWDRIDL